MVENSQTAPQTKPKMTVRQLRESGLIGLWQDRDDIQDSVAYARRLREQAQNREIAPFADECLIAKD